MEYVLGQTLQRYIECVGQPGPMRATHLMLQVATALAAAHRLNLVHRDIKPANVLLNEAGIAKLADFGLAKRVMGVGRFSKGHAPAGTPHYMSPELFDGHPADKRCDVYAMGVTFFYLLTGRLPFADRSFTDLAIRHAMDPVPDVLELCPDAPRDAIDIVNKCMAKEPSHRYEDAGQLVQEIRAVYGGLQCLESLVHEAVAELPIQVSGSANRYSLLVSLPGGRSQTVFVEACNAEPIAERVVKIYSLCGLASPNYFQRALELNASIPHGSIAIEPVEGKPYFVMCNTYPRSTCDVEEIRRSVQSIARHADDVEHFLTGNDRH
jgi:serine/threonine-protein kinase